MQWKEPVKIPDDINAELAGYSPIIRQLLYSRGIREKNVADKFLNPTFGDLIDPEKLFGIEKAVAIIEEAISKQKRIFIHGDFDVDGISATAVLWDYLYNKRKAKALPYIPSRIDEGYGMSEKSLNAIIKKGGEVVITVDCGIRDADLIAKYRKSTKNKKGLEFIVTDHHETGSRIPSYVPVIHPSHPKGNYGFDYLSGAGVAWKLIAGIEKLKFPESFAWENIDGLDLVALSIVCDIVPLVDENRVLLKYGLEKFRRTRNKGLRALVHDADLDIQTIDPYHLGYIIGPRINAAGRIGDALDALRLLSTDKDSTAKFLADKLGTWNKERQEITDRVMNEVRERIEKQGTGKHLYFAHGNDWPEGIIGLVAGKLQEELNRPVVLVSKNGKDSRGSARSIPQFNIIDAIERNAKLLEKYGGHTQAAGFTVDEANVEELGEKLEKWAVKQLKNKDLVKEIPADAIVKVQDMTWETWELIRQLAPFGYGNRRPVFWVNDAKIVDLKTVGEGKHLKFVVKGDGGDYLNCIFFGGGEFSSRLAVGDTVDMIGHLGTNVWNGEESLQFGVQDLRLD